MNCCTLSVSLSQNRGRSWELWPYCSETAKQLYCGDRVSSLLLLCGLACTFLSSTYGMTHSSQSFALCGGFERFVVFSWLSRFFFVVHLSVLQLSQTFSYFALLQRAPNSAHKESDAAGKSPGRRFIDAEKISEAVTLYLWRCRRWVTNQHVEKLLQTSQKKIGIRDDL